MLAGGLVLPLEQLCVRSLENCKDLIDGTINRFASVGQLFWGMGQPFCEAGRAPVGHVGLRGGQEAGATGVAGNFALSRRKQGFESPRERQ